MLLENTLKMKFAFTIDRFRFVKPLIYKNLGLFIINLILDIGTEIELSKLQSHKALSLKGS